MTLSFWPNKLMFKGAEKGQHALAQSGPITRTKRTKKRIFWIR